MEINLFLKKFPELEGFGPLIRKLYTHKDIVAMFLCGSRAKNTLNKKRELSDYDFFLICKKHISKMQAIHYKINNSRVELMYYTKSKFCEPSSYDFSLLHKILNQSNIIFSKEDCIKRQFLKYSRNTLTKGVSKSELESMWFKIIWNILKVRSYNKTDPQLAETLAMQNYFFIGLFYGRLCGEKIYNLSESLKYMRKTNPKIWKIYLKILKNKNKRFQIEKIIELLPKSRIFLKKEALMELDNFISPLTVIGNEDIELMHYKKSMDKIVIPCLSFLKKD